MPQFAVTGRLSNVAKRHLCHTLANGLSRAAAKATPLS